MKFKFPTHFQIDYSSRLGGGGTCKPSQDVVSVTCVHDSFASCPESGEVPWGGKCYSVHFEREDFRSASAVCAAEGKRLAEITSQRENDLLSELLLRSEYAEGVLSEAWTGGKASGAGARAPLYYWQGSRTTVDCEWD